MQLNLLDAIVRVRAELLLSNKCCKDFTVSPEMLKKTSHRTRFIPCVPLISGEDSDDVDLELFM
jgi:ornithine carbamoyltransferase